MSTLEWAISPEHPTESVAIETLLDEVLGQRGIGAGFTGYGCRAATPVA